MIRHYCCGIQACEVNRETMEEVAAAEAALHEASETVEKVGLNKASWLPRSVHLLHAPVFW
jgi:hypothetical protein